MGVDDTDRQFDAAGNVTVGTQVVENTDPYTLISTRVRAVNSRSYYDADERLRVFQQYDTDYSGNKGSGVWEEYRYDPLGRRVLVRTRRENPLCYGDPKTCISSVTRFVWSGDQILWELKDASGSYAADAGGRVSYVHAGGGIDRPLAIWKQGVGTLVTHQNWRGQFAMGTFTSGAPSDCQQYPPSGCVPVNWPGWGTTAWHEKVGTAPTTGYEHYWMGSLAVGMRDASGQMYMRNRYYDPQTGQFTPDGGGPAPPGPPDRPKAVARGLLPPAYGANWRRNGILPDPRTCPALRVRAAATHGHASSACLPACPPARLPACPPARLPACPRSESRLWASRKIVGTNGVGGCGRGRSGCILVGGRPVRDCAGRSRPHP